MIRVPTPIQQLVHPMLTEKKIKVYIKRDDLIHSEIMGNKWRKLKYNLMEAKQQGYKKLVTIGGAYSNHIAATAAAAYEFDFKSIGIIRGDELDSESNATLRFASSKGMEFRFVSREQYRNIRKNVTPLEQAFPDGYIIPEGGTNELAIKGSKEIIPEIDVNFDVIVCPVGTGGTLCGLISSLSSSQHAIGVSCLKGDFIVNEISELLKKHSIDNESYSIDLDYHFGGYAKTTPDLIEFINLFKEKFSISLDPIYTGKAFFGVWDMIKRNKFEENLRIILLHTGGLQGIEGFNRKNENIVQ